MRTPNLILEQEPQSETFRLFYHDAELGETLSTTERGSIPELLDVPIIREGDLVEMRFISGNRVRIAF